MLQLYLVVFLQCCTAQRPSPDKVQNRYSKSIRPLLEEKCGDCHWGEAAEGEIDFQSFETIEQMLHAGSQWQKVRDQVEHEQMPPSDYPPLKTGQKQELVQWIDSLFQTVDCSNVHPGRVTLRRLNRIEYRNTIRDLTGIEYPLADEFPGDDVGYGFNNIADVLSLPPILLEKYLQAAESISDQTVASYLESINVRSIAGKRLRSNRTSRKSGDNHVLITNGTIGHKIKVKAAGRYRLKVFAYGQQGGDEPVKMKVDFGDSSKTFKLEAESSVEESVVDLELDVAEYELGISFLNDYYQPDLGLDRNLIVNGVELMGPIGVTRRAHPVFQSWPVSVEPTIENATSKSIIERFATRAFRRPVTKDELLRLQDLFLQARKSLEFEAAIQVPIQAVLVSPQFLYKVEAPPPVSRQPHPLSNYELATSLSYFLWSSMPDKELFEVAREGRLTHSDELQKQVKRMLQSPKANALIENFGSQWFQLEILAEIQPDPDQFDNVDQRLLKDMGTETKLFFADIVKRDASIFELLSANYTYLNDRLAKHYGLNPTHSKKFLKTTLPKGQRGGLLTQGSFLTLTSNPTRTSPVKRGKWVMENLLGIHPPPPDPNVQALETQNELRGSLRQRMEQHRADPKCAGCHKTMDAIGFALEEFDAVGKWRTMDGDYQVDARGELPDGTEFRGAMELQSILQTKMKKQFLRTTVEKLLIYSLGRGLEFRDRCTVDNILKKVERADYQFSSMIIAIVESVPFQMRQRDDALRAESKK